MKLLSTENRQAGAVAYPLSKERVSVRYRKISRTKTITPPDEESCSRLNAMAKEYPFCIYFRERKNDPL